MRRVNPSPVGILVAVALLFVAGCDDDNRALPTRSDSASVKTRHIEGFSMSGPRQADVGELIKYRTYSTAGEFMNLTDCAFEQDRAVCPLNIPSGRQINIDMYVTVRATGTGTIVSTANFDEDPGLVDSVTTQVGAAEPEATD